MKTPELTEAEFAKLQAAHPSARLVAVTSGGHDFVLKAPPRSEWKRFRSMVLDPAKKMDATPTLVSVCLVWPSADLFAQILEDRPATLDNLGSKLSELAGTDDEVVEKKFGNSSSGLATT
jgi:hypothetical protein